MKDTIKMIVVLTLIATLAGLGLALMNEATQADIEDNARRAILDAIHQVLPDADPPNACQRYDAIFDNEPDRDAVCIEGATVFRARKGKDVVAMAMEVVGDNAYSGTISALVGLRMDDGMLMGIKVLAHAETPGLGSLISDCQLMSGQMVGHTPSSIKWAVKKDGGDIDQLTGATISTRAMINAVAKAQAMWRDHRQTIINGDAMPADGGCHVP